MRLISTKIHGILDYLLGTFLVAAPWILNFHRGAVETWILVIAGIIILVVSMVTDHETGVWRALSMRIHLSIDFFLGVLLAASPLLLGAGQNTYLPMMVGVIELVILIFSAREAADNKTRSPAKNSLSSWREERYNR